MGELASALDQLADDDLFALAAPELLDSVRELLAAKNRLDAELARRVRRSELAQAPEHDGLVSMRSWLRGHCRLSAEAAGQLVRIGRALEQLPAVAEAHAAGQVNAEQVAVIAKITAPKHQGAAAAHGVDTAAVEETFVAVATGQRHEALTRAVHHYLARLDPDGREPDPTERRSLVIVKHADGSVTGRFELDPVAAEKAQSALEAVQQADRPAGDTRTRSQQLGDAFVQLADNALAAGGLPFLRTIKPHVLVNVDLPELTDPNPGPAAAEAGFGAPLSAEQARQLSCDATVTRIVLRPDGAPLDLGRTHRVVPPHLRRAVEKRDKQCVFAGCHAPMYWCDVHHLLHWAHGGETSLDNSALLCERHHTKVHHGFRVERQPAGTWRTWRPDGTEILTPRPLDLTA